MNEQPLVRLIDDDEIFLMSQKLLLEPASRQKITQSPETKQTLLLKALFNRGFFLAP